MTSKCQRAYCTRLRDHAGLCANFGATLHPYSGLPIEHERGRTLDPEADPAKLKPARVPTWAPPPSPRPDGIFTSAPKPAPMQAAHDPINSPSHYQILPGVEVLDIIEALNLGYHLGNVAKYLLRAGRKGEGKLLEDLKKARRYLERKITLLEREEIRVNP